MINETRLTETITKGGLSWINFFNGRLLSGEDLSKEQSSNFEGRRRLGRAIGEGVAAGLEVSIPENVNTRETPYVVVKAGLAINQQGQTLSLAGETNVKLTRPLNTAATVAGSETFADCEPLQPGVYVADAGVYLLTIAPARKNEGRAVVSGLDNVIARCNTHRAIEGVQFRLIQLGLTAEELSDANADRLRNRIAYGCFGFEGTEIPPIFPVDPFKSAPPRRTLLDDLRPGLLTDCDVPLAIIKWTRTNGIEFVDMWSVRRHLFGPSAGGRWDEVLGERRRSEGEAMFLQFQEHALDLLDDDADPKLAVATRYFQHLPAAGVLPVGALSVKGFDYLRFFEGITFRRPVYLEGARVEKLLRDSWSYPPVDLRSGEMFWLYWVRENAQAVISSSAPLLTCLIFASGQMPFVADPRFDVARFNYSNFV